MPIVCTYKPNRTRRRRFTPRDAGRIVCDVIEQGYAQEEVAREVSRCLDRDDGK